MDFLDGVVRDLDDFALVHQPVHLARNDWNDWLVIVARHEIDIVNLPAVDQGEPIQDVQVIFSEQ